MSERLEQALEDEREQARVLRAHGHTHQAATLERAIDRVTTCMRSYLTILSEGEAQLRSGWSVDRLRGRFPEWEAAGFAWLNERGKRVYREAIVPKRSEAQAARLAGARGESLRQAQERHG